MKKRHIIIGGVLLGLLFCVGAEMDRLLAAGADLSPLPAQERFVYRTKFLGLPVGTYIIQNNGKTTLNGQEAYHFELTVKTLPFVSLLFKTKDRYVSYMDAEAFVVLRHEEYIRGGTVLESVVDFNYKDLTANYRNFINGQEYQVKISDKMFDILSGGFYLRMLPLQVGDSVALNVYADGKIFNYSGVLTGKTKIPVLSHGIQEAYSFKPALSQNGKPVPKLSGDVFFSTTTPMTPLRATLKNRFGKVNVILVDGFAE